MTYEKFKDEIVEAVSGRFNDDYEVHIMSMIKNNGLMLDGLVIREKNVNISPNIYINNYYERHLEGLPIDDVVDEIITCYESNKIEESINFDFFTDYEKVKDNIIVKVINRDKNQKLLSEVPSIDYLDLAIVFYYIFETEQIENVHSSILVRNEHINQWKVEINDLLDIAKSNTKRILGISVKNLFEYVANIMSEETQEAIDDMVPVYVVTNNRNTFGAAIVVFLDVLDELSKLLGDDLFIIPCSVHELLILAANQNELSTKGLKDTIHYVNNSELNAQEVLSDNLYVYEREKKRVYIK